LNAPGAYERVGVVAWNVQCGKHLDGLQEVFSRYERLRNGDLYLLTEVDIAVDGSGSVHVPRALAEHLGTGYVYCNMDLVSTPHDVALHGCALLTRWPVTRFACVPLVECRDRFHHRESRVGGKRALVCEVDLPRGPVTVAVTHLDPFAAPRHRAQQMRDVLEAVEDMGNPRALIGGDWNTTTYDLGTPWGLLANVVHKFARFGFAGTIEQYMTPERVFERPTFAALEQVGFEFEAYNERAVGTCYYDLEDAQIDAWTRLYIPRWGHRWLRKRLKPWNDGVPLRIDWMAGRDLRPANAAVIDRPTYRGSRVSDHNPIVVDLLSSAPDERVG
jgi:endonuclease/exonuclease/phosphatase family metal-dependent hydrolase